MHAKSIRLYPENPERKNVGFPMPKRLISRLVLAGSVVLAAFLPCATSAQEFTRGPIKIIVTNPPGGSSDIAARLVGQKLSEALRQSVVIENVAGASGSIGINMLKRAAPDGHTLGVVQAGSQTIDLVQNKKRSFDIAKDFSPITAIAINPSGLLVNSKITAATMAELIEQIRAKPGAFSYGSTGIGTALQLYGEVLNKVSGINMVNVPYSGVTPALNDLIAGHIPIAIVSVAIAVPHLGGKVRLMTIFDTKRDPNLPEVPAITEVVPNYEPGRTWVGILAPPYLPEPIAARLNSEIVRILKSPDVVATLGKSGLEIVANSREEFSEMIRRDAKIWDEAAVMAGLAPPH
jgi:tripartite-type tricarboxylate transporter receptor subunit TctC